MILTAIIGLLQSILYDVVLFYLGKLLSNPIQFRNYLGMTSQYENENNFIWAAFWVKRIGKLLMVIAIISMITSIISTITILLRF